MIANDVRFLDRPLEKQDHVEPNLVHPNGH